MIAPDSKTAKSSASRSTMAGIRPLGLIAVNHGSFCAPEREVEDVDLVGQAQLLEQDRDLPAVGRGGGVEVDHSSSVIPDLIRDQ
jgi:hypothetical protein